MATTQPTGVGKSLAAAALAASRVRQHLVEVSKAVKADREAAEAKAAASQQLTSKGGKGA